MVRRNMRNRQNQRNPQPQQKVGCFTRIVTFFLCVFMLLVFGGGGIALIKISSEIEADSAEFVGIYEFVADSVSHDIEKDEIEDGDGDIEIVERDVYKMYYKAVGEKYGFSESISEYAYDNFKEDETYRPKLTKSVWSVGDGFEYAEENATAEDALKGRKREKKGWFIGGIVLILIGLFMVKKCRYYMYNPSYSDDD